MDADEMPDGHESLGEAGREQEPLGVRLKLGIAYDGAGFSGWAPQAERRTVAGVLTEALGKVLRLPEAPRLTVAGRTDAGVHARGQVAHVNLREDAWLALSVKRGRTEPPPDPDAAAIRAMLVRMASALPDDVRVRSVELAPPGFDARFSALWRRYSYRVCDDFGRADPLRRQDTLWYQRPLDIDAMNTAAAGLTGEHDFAAFCKKREGATTVRGLRWLDWRRDEDGIAVARVVADAFCHNMVRALVGSLLPVGAGDQPAEWPAAVLAAGVRDPGVRVAPAHPLCLEEVRYPDPGQLAARAEQTRQIRVLSLPGGTMPSGSDRSASPGDTPGPPRPPDARPMAGPVISPGTPSPSA